MRAVRNLLAEARAEGMIRPLAFDALAMALAFAALAGFWIMSTPDAVASPSPASVPTDALATGGEG